LKQRKEGESKFVRIINEKTTAMKSEIKTKQGMKVWKI